MRIRSAMSTLLSLLFLLSLLAAPIRADMVDFSKGLLDYMARRFGWEAPGRLLTLQNAVRQIKTSNADILRNQGKTGDGIREFPLIKQVNDLYNQIPYFSDKAHWGVDDYWATPFETVASLGADCEDYAIAKYMTLKDLGIPVDRMRITYVRAIRIGETHMVLAYYPTPDADPLILDNLIPDIKPGSIRTDLVPVYSFNDEDLWLAAGPARKGGASSVRLWRDLIERMDKERKM